MRQWEERLSRAQRRALTLALAGLILGAGFLAWRQWPPLFSEGMASAAFGGPAERPRISLPRPAGARVVLPPGAIPAINNPTFVPVAEARARDDSPMILVSRGGETHVYSIYLLDGHEIVNDVIAGEPIATTW